ncbi:MAG: ATP-binding cassette domain-containing protein [SAR324 cluster bacterium]|nr:ATP-binding cassette domain-containing protein [SAR324 cluster bacterium]
MNHSPQAEQPSSTLTFKLPHPVPVVLILGEGYKKKTNLLEISITQARIQRPENMTLPITCLQLNENLSLKITTEINADEAPPNEILIHFSEPNAQAEQLDQFITYLLRREYQPVDVDDFRFLIHCMALDGLKSKETETLTEWLRVSEFPPEVSDAVLLLLQMPPAPSLAFQKVKEYLLFQRESDLSLKKTLWHNLGILMSAEHKISIHQKLIIRTIIETIPALSAMLDEFRNTQLVFVSQKDLHAREYILRTLKQKIQASPQASWDMTDNELWIVFLVIKLGRLFVSSAFLREHLKWYTSLIQPYFLLHETLLQDLIESSLSDEEFKDNDLVDEFLLVADPDQRSILIEILREMISTQSKLSRYKIDIFARLVQGRGKIMLVSPEQGLGLSDILTIGPKPEHQLRLSQAPRPDCELKIEFMDQGFRIQADEKTSFYVGGRRYQQFEGNQSFLQFRLEQTKFYFFPQARILFYEQHQHHYLSLNNYEVLVKSHARLFHFSRQSRHVLKHIQVSFRSGEFTGIFGPTGAGKSSLLRALLNQYENHGDIWFDGISYRDYYQNHIQEVGYVPQDEVLYRDLTIHETLHYSILLRGLARKRKDVKSLIDQTIQELGLEKAIHVLIGDDQKQGISGGQRKRVNLALELLSPNTLLLMLDEPTSGLDPSTELQTHKLLRNLAAKGLFVLVVSHSLYEATMNILDMALILTDQGEIAYYGPSIDAKSYFQVETPEEIFNVLSQYPSTHWVQKYHRNENPYYRKYVLSRLNFNQTQVIDTIQSSRKFKEELAKKQDNLSRATGDALDRKPGWFTQSGIFIQRQAKRQFRDLQSLFSRTSQAVLLALVLRIAYTAPESGLLTLMSIIPVWMGATMSVRAINSEYSIFLRERRYGIGIVPYVVSLFVVHSLVIFPQILIFLGCLYLMIPLSSFGFAFADVFLIIYLTSLTGINLGILLSAVFTSQQASVNALPVFLVLMILFGGSVIAVKEMGTMSYAASNITPTRWALEGLLYEGECMVSKVPSGTSWEWCGQVDDALRQQMQTDKLYPLEMKSPHWATPWYNVIMAREEEAIKVGIGLRALGFYRPMECTLDNYDFCPQALIHRQWITINLILISLVMLTASILVLVWRTRK